MSKAAEESSAGLFTKAGTGVEQVFIDIGAAMAGTRDYASMLAAVIDTACKAVGASGGGFMRLDPATEELVLQAPAFGVHDELTVSQYRTSLSGGGNAARVFLSRNSHISNDARQDPRFIQRFVKLFDTYNTLTVPLVLRDRAIGIFHAINKTSGDFTDADRDKLLSVAPLLASCLQLALIFRAFEDERRQFERTMTAHEQLLNSAGADDGPESLCKTLAGLLHRPVLLLDGLRRPLVSIDWHIDHALIAREVAKSELVDGELGAISAGDSGIVLAVMAIPVARSRGGYLLIGDAPARLDPVDIKAVQQTATFVAVEIFKHRSLSAAKHRAAGAAVIELFSEGLDTALARELLARIGVESAGPWRLALLSFRARNGSSVDAEIHQHATALRDALERALGPLRHRCRLLSWRSSFVIIADAGIVDQLSERVRIRALQEALDAMGPPMDDIELRIGIGRVEHAAQSFGKSLQGAEQALAAIDRLGRRSRVLRFEDLGVHRLLLGSNDDAEQAAFVESVFAPLRKASTPANARTQLQTLKALAANNFSPAPTARTLGVHLNTVKYRLAQLRDIYGHDPASGDLRLEIELAIRIEALRGQSKTN